jgi:hypothetical protein
LSSQAREHGKDAQLATYYGKDTMHLEAKPGESVATLVVDFGVAGNGADYRRTGWADPEPWHTWTIGAESRLELPRPAMPGTYRLVLDLGPFVWKQKLPVQRLSILVNDCEVGTFFVREVTRIECPVPWNAIGQTSRVAVTFRHRDAARPRDVSGAPDDREIALAFRRLSLFRQTDVSATGELPLDRLMLQFESLGENCEFGLAQRRCGADPLGLLRFASAPIPALLSGLKARFEGIGDWDQLEVRISENQLEYLVFDKRFGFLYHPWVLIGEASAESIHQREAKQLPRLRRKLVDDLMEARKIFVYHSMQPLPQPLVRRLLAAMRAYGPSTLLWVELQDKGHPAGTVERIGTGLLKGYIDRFAPGENAHDLSLEGWVALCRSAWALAPQSVK